LQALSERVKKLRHRTAQINGHHFEVSLQLVEDTSFSAGEDAVYVAMESGQKSTSRGGKAFALAGMKNITRAFTLKRRRLELRSGRNGLCVSGSNGDCEEPRRYTCAPSPAF
jgi:hypothetical protein